MVRGILGLLSLMQLQVVKELASTTITNVNFEYAIVIAHSFTALVALNSFDLDFKQGIRYHNY